MSPDAETLAVLARLVRGERVCTLATLRGGAPLASMTAYLAEDDFSAFWLHVSMLAWHTQDMLADARVSLSIAETDDGRDNPFLLARLTLRGEAERLAHEDARVPALRERWCARHPATARHFELADFHFFRVMPRDARFVAGFGRIHDLSAARLAGGPAP